MTGILIAIVVTALVCAGLAWLDAALFTVLPRERTRRRMRVNAMARRMERMDRKEQRQARTSGVREPIGELALPLTRRGGDRRLVVAGVIWGKNRDAEPMEARRN